MQFEGKSRNDTFTHHCCTRCTAWANNALHAAFSVHRTILNVFKSTKNLKPLRSGQYLEFKLLRQEKVKLDDENFFYVIYDSLIVKYERLTLCGVLYDSLVE
jgi:hypothetical protein